MQILNILVIMGYIDLHNCFIFIVIEYKNLNKRNHIFSAKANKFKSFQHQNKNIIRKHFHKAETNIKLKIKIYL